MAQTKLFALICWILWAGLLAAWALDMMRAALAAFMAACLYILWRLYRRSAATQL